MFNLGKLLLRARAGAGANVLATSSGTALVEPLESRQFFSTATSITMTPSTKKLTFGQTFDVTVTVAARTGKAAPRGYVRLYLGKNPSLFEATLNAKGKATIVIDQGLTLSPGTYSLTTHYVAASTKFAASISKKAPLTVSLPATATTASDGLVTATVVAGKGPAVVAGNSVTVEYTAYNNNSETVGNTSALPGKKFTFTEDADPAQVIAGFGEGVHGMRVGEIRDIDVPASLNGNTNEQVLFAVKLLSINS